MANQIVTAHDMTDVLTYVTDAMLAHPDADDAPEALVVMDLGDDAKHAATYAHTARALAHDVMSATTTVQRIVDTHVADPRARAEATRHLADIGMQVPYLADGVQKHVQGIQTAYALMAKLKAQRDMLSAQIAHLEEQLEDAEQSGDPDLVIGTLFDEIGISSGLGEHLWRLGQGDSDAINDLIEQTQMEQDMDEVQAAAVWHLALGLMFSNRHLNALRVWLKTEAERRKAQAEEAQS